MSIALCPHCNGATILTEEGYECHECGRITRRPKRVVASGPSRRTRDLTVKSLVNDHINDDHKAVVEACPVCVWVRDTDPFPHPAEAQSTRP